jgi:uncharacterized protein YjbI with pentapeptide repeats
MAKKKAARRAASWKTLRLQGQTVCIAGKGKQFSASANEVKRWCIDDGATIVSDVTDKTDMLVLMDIGVATAKKKAEKLNKQGAGIVTIDLPDLRQMFVPTEAEFQQALTAGAAGRKRIAELLLRCRAVHSVVDMTGINLKAQDLTELELHGLVLRGADLRETTLHSTNVDELRDVRMDKAKGGYFHAEAFYNCQCKDAQLECFFLGARAQGKDVFDSDFSHTNFHRGYFRYAEIARSKFKKSSLVDASLAESTINDCDFSGADFSQADLSGSVFRGSTKLTGAKFCGADLSNTNFGDSDLSKADFSGARLTGAILDKATLAGANFADAVLINVSLGRADTSKVKNLALPPVTKSKSGPACKSLDAPAKKATDLQVSADVLTPDGPVTITARANNQYGSETFATYEILNKVVEQERLVKTSRSTLRFDRRNFKDRIEVPCFSAALEKLGQLWGHGQLQFETIRCSASKSPLKGKALQTAAIEALAEVFGKPAPTPSETKAIQSEKRAAGKALQEQLLSELRGGKKGIDAFNGRDADRLRRNKQFRFRREDFSGAKMSGLVAKEIDFQDCQLTNANLSRAELPSADFRGADLSGASCKQADLTAADLRKCKLVGANFAKTCLDYARLDEADLTGADLSGAKLYASHIRGTNLSGVKFKGATWIGSVFDTKTVFPDGFEIPEDFDFDGPGHDPRLDADRVADVESVESFDQFMKQVAAKVDAARLDKALKMLKAERFQLYSDVDNDSCIGVVRSQTDADLVYICRLTSSGDFSCCTQNLNACGGLRGAPCKHLLVLLIGLTKAEQIDAKKAAAWIHLSQIRKPALDKDLMAEALLKFKGVETGEIDWRPTETVPEDYFAM